MKIFKTIVNLAIGLGGLGVILHLHYKKEDLEAEVKAKERESKFWKNAFKSESKRRIEYLFDLSDWRRLYKKYGWEGNLDIWDRSTIEHLTERLTDDELKDLRQMYE